MKKCFCCFDDYSSENIIHLKTDSLVVIRAGNESPSVTLVFRSLLRHNFQSTINFFCGEIISAVSYRMMHHMHKPAASEKNIQLRVFHKPISILPYSLTTISVFGDLFDAEESVEVEAMIRPC